MILYFTGTGNSEFVAERIGEKTGDETLNLFDKIRVGIFQNKIGRLPLCLSYPPMRGRFPILSEIGSGGRSSAETVRLIL